MHAVPAARPRRCGCSTVGDFDIGIAPPRSSRLFCTPAASTLYKQVVEKILQLAAAGLLGNQFEGSLGQRVDGARAVALAERRDHDDPQVAHRPQLAQHLDAVDLGHREVEREHVGLVFTACFDRFAPVGDDRHDLHARAGQDVADQPAHEC